MSNTETATPAKPKRELIAKRQWLDDAGKELSVGDGSVRAILYTFLKSGNQIKYTIGENDALDRRFCAMGAVTKIGNLVNTIVNDDSYDGRDPIPEVTEWLADAQAGEWREAGEVRGPKYDKDVLAGVLVELLEAGGKAQGDVMHYREKLDDKSYYAKVRANTQIMAKYLALMAEKGEVNQGVDSLA